jgi:hypothetical protein
MISDDESTDDPITPLKKKLSDKEISKEGLSMREKCKS